MQTISQIDEAGVYTGVSIKIEDADGCPPGWVRSEPPAPAPPNKVAQWRVDGWVFVTLADLPAPPMGVVTTFKADLWRRATLAEAAIMSADLQDADAQLRELYLAVQFLDHAAPEFPVLRGALLARFTPERVDELLAPSEA